MWYVIASVTVIGLLLWLWLGYLGSRIWYRYWVRTFKMLEWTPRHERNNRFFILLGPFNLFGTWITTRSF